MGGGRLNEAGSSARLGREDAVEVCERPDEEEHAGDETLEVVERGVTGNSDLCVLADLRGVGGMIGVPGREVTWTAYTDGAIDDDLAFGKTYTAAGGATGTAAGDGTMVDMGKSRDGE